MDELLTNQDRGVVLIVYAKIFCADDHGASSITILSTFRRIKMYLVKEVCAECNLKNRNLKYFNVSGNQPWIIDMLHPLT